MFGFIGKMFGSDKAAESLIDNASNALDKLWYTDEEKAEDRAKSASEARGMVIDWLRNTQGQNIARRFLAIVISIVWISQYVAMMCLSIANVWLENKKLIESADVIGSYAQSMNSAMILILGFYFAAPHLGDIAQSALKQFNRGK